MNKQFLKNIEREWEAYFAIDIGIDRTEFLKRIGEIQQMINAQSPIQQILDKVTELQNIMKNKSITSNSTAMKK